MARRVTPRQLWKRLLRAWHKGPACQLEMAYQYTRALPDRADGWIVLADGLLERRNVARLHLDEHGAMFGLREPRPVDEDIAEVEAAHAIPVVDRPLRHVVEERHVGEPADR